MASLPYCNGVMVNDAWIVSVSWVIPKSVVDLLSCWQGRFG